MPGFRATIRYRCCHDGLRPLTCRPTPRRPAFMVTSPGFGCRATGSRLGCRGPGPLTAPKVAVFVPTAAYPLCLSPLNLCGDRVALMPCHQHPPRTRCCRRCCRRCRRCRAAAAASDVSDGAAPALSGRVRPANKWIPPSLVLRARCDSSLPSRHSINTLRIRISHPLLGKVFQSNAS